MGSLGGNTTTVRFVAVVIASVGIPSSFNVTAAAAAEHAEVSAIDPAELLQEHTEAWAKLTSSNIEVGGDSSRAWSMRTHFWSAYYFLMSSIRSDWSLGGLSPGGLASQNYEGAVFMDMDLHMAP